MSLYSLRMPDASDYEFLKRVHHVTLRDHVSKIWGWENSAQDEFFKEDFDSGQIRVLDAFSESVGYMQLKLDSGALHLVNILILPEFQNRGIGTEVIKNLITESEKDGRVLKLGVFKINERARKLYESLGFKTYGETPTHFLMQR